MIEHFDDDPHYLRWLVEHPNGYVVNAERPPRAAYLMLHKARCGTITGEPTNGSSWTKDYMKICAPRIEPLTDWASTVGGSLQRCGRCHP